ncbi:MAG: ABC transporter ATP-binding protein [Hyphomicrobiaceae bacterium]
MSATPAVLAVAGLAKTFAGFRAVQDVAFTVEAGELVALIGPNGAGKTTTFNMINGQLKPDAGRVLLDGRDVTGMASRELWRRGVARTFQITATFASMTVIENIIVALISRDRTAGRAIVMDPRHRDEALVLLGEIGMMPAADRVCGVLAYGDLKRVELALALVNAPRLLLMDEPTAGMAPNERGALMGLVARIARERRTAVLFTEHDMDVVFRHADRILVMNRGKLIASGRPEEVRRNPLVREVYLGAGAASGQG